MAIYEYECQKCGHRFEVMQSMTEDPLETCSKDRCKGKKKDKGKGELKKLISKTSFSLKGGGWAKDGYGG